MIQHTVVTSQSAYESAICWGQREPLPEWDPSAEPTAMELFSPNSQCQDIEVLYCEICQLHRLPRQNRCEELTAEWLHKEIMDSIKEYLRLKWPPTQQERQQAQLPANNPRPDPHTAFAAANQRVYEEMMALARDAQQWAISTAAILGEWMERMGHPLTANAPPPIGILPAARGPDPQDGEKKVPRRLHTMGKLRPDQKIPRWPPAKGGLEILICMNTKRHPGQLHAKGALLRNGPSHPVTQFHKMEMLGDICWWEVPLPGKAQGAGWWNTHMTPRHKWAISCPHHHDRWLRQHHKKWHIGQDEGRHKPPHLKRKMWTSGAHCNLSPTSSNSWVRKSSLQGALMFEMAFFCHHCWCHHHPHHHHLLKT